MTHLDNLESILRSDGLKSYNSMRGSFYCNLANEDVQAGRASRTIPVSGRALHDYVPLYFGFKTPMVACNQEHNEDLLFLRFSLDILATPGAIFSDGNARTLATQFFAFNTVDDLAAVDPSAINTVKYGGDEEKKRRKQAEVLIPDFVPFSKVLDIVAFSVEARSEVLALLAKFGKNQLVRVNHMFYFVPRES
jgi:hypothetical protein